MMAPPMPVDMTSWKFVQVIPLKSTPVFGITHGKTNVNDFFINDDLFC